MIIGQFCDTYPPMVDGVGRVTLSYCQTLTAMGHEAYYIAPQSPNTDEVFGIPVILSASLKVPGELFRMQVPGLDLRYRKQVSQIPFDIVHAQDPFIAGEEALRIARKRDIPLVSTFHSKYYDDAVAKTHSKTLAKGVVQHIVRFYDKCDGVWTVNNATADVLREYGYRGQILITAGEDADHRDALGTGPAHLQFQLVTAGDGPDYDAIVHEAMGLGIADRCQFLGFMRDREELMALYSKADLLVFPSLYDNAPMVLREAAVMGTPGLVVKDSCSAEGVTDDYNGFISPDESKESIAETIMRALPRVEEVGANARETIPVSWQEIIKRVVAEYTRLIEGHQPA